VFHGVAMVGGIVTTINPTYTETELTTQLRDSGARMLVTIPPLVPMAARAQVTEIYVLGEARGEPGGRAAVLPHLRPCGCIRITGSRGR
jgi:acyl-CoA synthetase (AMP-forming)/AMP-acid ligase II